MSLSTRETVQTICKVVAALMVGRQESCEIGDADAGSPELKKQYGGPCLQWKGQALSSIQPSV